MSRPPDPLRAAAAGPRTVVGPVTVRTPATSANLGPCFDSAGLALALHDEVTAEVTGGGLAVLVEGEGSDSLPTTARHLVVASLHAALQRLGVRPVGLRVHCRNRVPQSRGLGSSSSAIVAGVLLGRALVVDGEALLDDDAVLGLADELEGHPDNVAACLRGGLTLAWRGPAGVRVVGREVHPGVRPVVLVPTTRSSTKQVRGLLPGAVPHADAAAGAARAALLALALTGDPALLLEATVDLLHQPYRAPAMPATAELVAALREGGVAAVVSGAGPTVLALCMPDQVGHVCAGAPAGWAVHALQVDRDGAQVVVGA